MKNFFKNMFMIASLAIVFTACKKEKTTGGDNTPGIVVPQIQNVIVVEPTATWCGPCGTYGKPATDQAVDGNSRAITIYAHLKAPASDLGAQVGQDLAVIYGAANANGTQYSIPKIGVGNNITPAYTSIDATVNKIKEHMNSAFAITSVANTKIETSIDGSTLKVKSHTKFFASGDANSTYKLSVILTESGISNRQNYNGTGYKVITHNHIARTTISASTSGDDLVATGAPSEGQLISKEFSTTLNSNWNKSNLTVIAIIWRLEGNKLYFVNADKIDLD